MAHEDNGRWAMLELNKAAGVERRDFVAGARTLSPPAQQAVA